MLNKLFISYSFIVIGQIVIFNVLYMLNKLDKKFKKLLSNFPT
jgi:hypothetical protein